MTNISPVSSTYSRTMGQSKPASERDTRTEAAGKAESDSLDISDEAKRLREEAEPESLMEPAKRLRKGSETHEKFRELLSRVKKQKSDVMTRIEDALAKAGVGLAGMGKLKIEIDASGKVVAGGIDDEKTLRAVEKALNADPTLAADIAHYQKDEKDLSRAVKDYTGCTLYELTMTAGGDINGRIRSRIEGDGEYDMGVDYYLRLGFLGSAREFIDVDDVQALSFGGNIDFSGELEVMADPEGAIKNELNDMYAAIQDAFAAANEEILNTLAARGIDAGAAAVGQYLLDAKNVAVTIDSNGGYAVAGTLSEDGEINALGVELVEKIVREMLAKTGDNSYHVNTFLAACQNLVYRRGDDSGAADRHGKAVAEFRNGNVSEIRVDAQTLSKPHAAFKDMAITAMSGVLRKCS